MKPYTTTFIFIAEPATPAKWECNIEGNAFTQANDLLNVYEWFRAMIVEQVRLANEVARTTMLEF